jgi:light-regulated signal transduction histidine kinase (bacteriophytochrome)/CheY-like chemotaxis protein
MDRNSPHAVTIDDCAREPIHILGAIQSFGYLLSVNADWLVVRASENVAELVGVGHAEVLGQPVSTFMSAALLHDIRSRLQVAGGMGIVERLFGQRLAQGGARLDIAIHQSGTETILEFEPSDDQPMSPLTVLRAMTARLERQTSPSGIYREVARQVRGLTGFDRVMVYRFDEDGAGEVVAEAANHDLPPFLGLRYPASDIPAQARALYERNYLRVIADVDAPVIPILPALSPEGAALDLTMSTLRSVSPIHLEYLRNMGVRSSMSISILSGGKLWGLIACHHGTPKYINLEIRSTAEAFGQTLSYLLEVRNRESETASDAQAKLVHDRIVVAFAKPSATLVDMPEFLTSVADFIPADGIGAYYAGQISLVGHTPTREEFLQVVTFLNKTASGRVYATDALSEAFPTAANFVTRAAGLLSIPVSRSPRDYLVFFRREALTFVTWAGEPGKLEASGPNGQRLTPRKSFAAWQESVHNRCMHWSKGELRNAESLRVTLIEVVLRMTEAAQTDSSAARQHQEILIAELNHRARNILGLVRGLVNQSAVSASDLRAFVKSLDNRIGSLARAHDLLNANPGAAASLHDLLHLEMATYSELESRLSCLGPDVMLQPKAFSAMALVIHELVTNARKYGALSVPSGMVKISTSIDDIKNIQVTWKEFGGPLVIRPVRRGFGSTLIEQLIPFEMNGFSRPRFSPEGFEIDMMLPAAVAEEVEPSGKVQPIIARVSKMADDTQLKKLLRKSLVVEDNLFIALDVEDMLRALGAETIVIASSIIEALIIIERERFSFALLDVSLGSDNSLPVARLLLGHNIPFAFGTGYGEGLVLPDSMGDAPIIAKPYHRAALHTILMRMVEARRDLVVPVKNEERR